MLRTVSEKGGLIWYTMPAVYYELTVCQLLCHSFFLRCLETASGLIEGL